MVEAESLVEVFPDVWEWSAFSPEHRVELTSHAVRTGAGWVVFDPLPLRDELWRHWPAGGPVAGVVLTNGNHVRGVREWLPRVSGPVWGRRGVDYEGLAVEELEPGPGSGPWSGWEVVDLAGGGPGETAWVRADRQLAVVGDAVVHLAGRGLEVLPDRYCTDPVRLRQALGRLARLGFDRLVVAHGRPLEERAAARVAALLGTGTGG
ncbi:MAG: hypothetical protein ACKO3N_16145 [Verrucomicrobiota bacterium]